MILQSYNLIASTMWPMKYSSSNFAAGQVIPTLDWLYIPPPSPQQPPSPPSLPPLFAWCSTSQSVKQSPVTIGSVIPPLTPCSLTGPSHRHYNTPLRRPSIFWAYSLKSSTSIRRKTVEYVGCLVGWWVSSIAHISHYYHYYQHRCPFLHRKR